MSVQMLEAFFNADDDTPFYSFKPESIDEDTDFPLYEDEFTKEQREQLLGYND
jgi:hypothetical protein